MCSSLQIATNVLKKHRNIWVDSDELLGPEVVFWIAQQFDEGDQSTPWMGTVNNEAFEEDLDPAFLEPVIFDFQEKVKDQRGEPMGVGVRVSEVEHDRAE